jgi:hypothetical protein
VIQYVPSLFVALPFSHEDWPQDPENDVVIFDNKARLKWQMGIVIKVHQGGTV